MLTTAGDARLAAALKLPGVTTATPDAERLGAVTIETTLGRSMPPARCSHSGLSVATTKSTASSTVTAWEKISQVLRM